MFDHMGITETIYEGVVEPSLKKTTRADANHSVQRSQIRGVYTLSKTHPDMIIRGGKRRKRYVYHLRDRPRLTCLIHGNGQY